MARKNIIIKPHLKEKSNELASDPNLNQYTFVVAKDANKVEIRKAVEEQFDVTVLAVNTLVLPGKAKSRIVKGRMTSGKTSPIKKAIITIAEGEIIEGYFGAEEFDEGLDADAVEVEE